MMLAVAFDTLKLARKFEAAGFPPKQAQDASAALSESFSEWQEQQQLATKSDLTASENKLMAAIASTKTDLTVSENKLLAAIENNKAMIASTKSELALSIEKSKSDIIKWMISMMVALAAFLYGVARLHG